MKRDLQYPTPGFDLGYTLGRHKQDNVDGWGAREQRLASVALELRSECDWCAV